MKIRGLIAGLLVAASLGGCTRSATAPEAPRNPVVAAPAFQGDTLPSDTSIAGSTQFGGGGIGSGH